MVNPNLLTAVRQHLKTPQRILVTGGTGFVGSHLARTLAEAGHQVIVTGRSKYRTNRILHPQIEFHRVDIRDADRVTELCRNVDIVYHVAALTTPWANRKRIEQINVRGTENVVQACRQNGVDRLVHVSSTAVFFNFTDMHNQHDSAPYPSRAACPYSLSKQRAEEVVSAATAKGQNIFTVRARAVFGPGDNALVPRLIHAARNGRLRQIGDGENLLDLTYIDNLVYALTLAAVRGSAGGCCTITNGEPVQLWKWLPTILEELSIPYQGKRIPYRLAYAVAWLGELTHWLLSRTGEPSLTRYTVGLLAKHQVFDQQNAFTELGYEPMVSMKEGIARTLASYTAKEEARDESNAPTTVKTRCFTTGYTTANRRVVERGAKAGKINFHALAALIEHPTHGLTLFDTGYAPRLKELSGSAARLFNWLLPAEVSSRLTVASQLRNLKIDPNDVQQIVISHFHPDHIAGLKDFPQARFIATRTAWEEVRGVKGFRALAKAHLPGLLPDDFEARLHLIEGFHDPGMGPFRQSCDLFGDGSVRLLPLPGHAAGQIGALLQSGESSQQFLLADAAWTTTAIRNRSLPSPVTRVFLDSFKEVKQTLTLLNQFQADFPNVELIPTHCPEVADRYGFDKS